MNLPCSAPRISGELARYTVEAVLHEVDLPDHSLHAFHYLRDPGESSERSMHLRALALPDGFTYGRRQLSCPLDDNYPGRSEAGVLV